MWPSPSYIFTGRPENLFDYILRKNIYAAIESSLSHIIISLLRPPATVLLYYFGRRRDLTLVGVLRAESFFIIRIYPSLTVFVKSHCGLDTAAADRPTIICTVAVFVLESGKIYCGNTRAPSDNLFETVMVILRQTYVSSRNESVRTLPVVALGRIILSDCIYV